MTNNSIKEKLEAAESLFSHVKYCPECYATTIVTDVRPTITDVLRRRRKCPECGHVFYTKEIVESELDDVLLRTNTTAEDEALRQVHYILQTYYKKLEDIKYGR